MPGCIDSMDSGAPVWRLPRGEGQIHRINAARHRFDGLESIESMPGCIDSMELAPRGPGPALVIFFRRAKEEVAFFSTPPLESLTSEGAIPEKKYLDESHESTSDSLKAWFLGGSPPRFVHFCLAHYVWSAEIDLKY